MHALCQIAALRNEPQEVGNSSLYVIVIQWQFAEYG